MSIWSTDPQMNSCIWPPGLYIHCITASLAKAQCLVRFTIASDYQLHAVLTPAGHNAITFFSSQQLNSAPRHYITAPVLRNLPLSLCQECPAHSCRRSQSAAFSERQNHNHNPPYATAKAIRCSHRHCSTLGWWAERGSPRWKCSHRSGVKFVASRFIFLHGHWRWWSLRLLRPLIGATEHSISNGLSNHCCSPGAGRCSAQHMEKEPTKVVQRLLAPNVVNVYCYTAHPAVPPDAPRKIYTPTCLTNDGIT